MISRCKLLNMPKTKLIFYADAGKSPVFDWLMELWRNDQDAYASGLARLELLKEHGFELRRPIVDYVESGLYELRWKQGHVQYRILYFYYGRNIAVLGHGLTKEKKLDPRDIKRALKRKRAFE